MMKMAKSALALLAVLCACALALAQGDESSQVLVLDASNFDEAIQKHSILLVEFYAPWCGHCKKLEPEFDAAAADLSADGLFIAKVNADDAQNKELAQRYGVRGFPTLKVFRNGETAGDYEGQRNAQAIAAFVRKQNQPAIVPIPSLEEVESFSEKDKVCVVGIFTSESSEEAKKAFEETASKLRNDFTFGSFAASSADEAQKAAAAVLPEGESAPGFPLFVLLKSFDDGNVVFNSNKEESAVTAAALTDFVRTHATPLIDEIGPANYKAYSEAGLPLAYIFVSPKNEGEVEDHVSRLSPIAKATKGKVNWVWIDSTQYGRHGERLGLSGSVFPALTIDKMDTGAHFAYPEDAELTFDAVNAWVDRFLAGELEPTVRSEDVPTEEERASQAVRKLVAKTFEEDVINSDADVFVEFYAPWCGHCKKLAPTWESLAAAIKSQGGEGKVVIAAIDATANDVDAKYGVKGFPTLKFFKAGNKDEPIDYTGDRSEGDLITFINEYASGGFELAPASEAAGGAEDDSKDEL